MTTPPDVLSLAKAFRASPDAVSILRRADGRLIEVNDCWTVTFGFTREEAIGRSVDELRLFINPADRNRMNDLIAAHGAIRDFEIDVRTKGGEVRRASLFCEIVDVGSEPCLITMSRDVTERWRAEHEILVQRRELAHLARVAILGELSGALAHELNQPLAAILANARAAQRLLQRAPVDPGQLRDILEDIVADDRRAGTVIHRVRTLLRKDDGAPQRLAVNDLVAEVLDLAHSDLIQRGVSITTHLSPALPPVTAERVQVQQVLLNVLVNACEAMADNLPADRVVQITTAADGARVRVSVSDHGPGITTHPIDSVFEPFVTSKPQGLGLGLSICRSITDAHGGHIWAVNNEGRGATFHVQLPQSSLAESGASLNGSKSPMAMHGRARDVRE